MIDDVDVKLLESRDRSRAADLISEVFSPPIVVVVLLTAVSLHSSRDLPSALGWIALTTTFCAAIPYLLLLRSVRAGRVTDRHLVRRAERRGPLLAALVSVVIGLAILVWLGAPRAIIALVIAFVTGLAIILPLTVQWKLSMHMAVIAGGVAVVATMFGIVSACICASVLPVVAWSRIQPGRHTAVQVILGTVTGYLITVTAFAVQSPIL